MTTMVEVHGLEQPAPGARRVTLLVEVVFVERSGGELYRAPEVAHEAHVPPDGGQLEVVARFGSSKIVSRQTVGGDLEEATRLTFTLAVPPQRVVIERREDGSVALWRDEYGQ